MIVFKIKKAFRLLSVFSFALVLLGSAACADSTNDNQINREESGNDTDREDTDNPGDSNQSISEVRSEKQHIQNPSASQSDLETLASDNAKFNADLYKQLADSKSGKNLFYSPYSISSAFAMIYGGAVGQTDTQIADTFHYTLGQNKLHPTYNRTNQVLNSLGSSSGNGQRTPFELTIANSVWGEKNFSFKQPYLDLMAQQYGAGLRTVNFRENAEGARKIINKWVADKTEDNIEKLIPKNTLNQNTRLVLTNAVYFNASWARKFDESNTEKREFTKLDGSKIQVPTMKQTVKTQFAETSDAKFVELPYHGDKASMIVALPKKEFGQFEQNLSASTFKTIETEGDRYKVKLELPKLEYEAKIDLNEQLQALGMSNPFSPNKADFSGITDKKPFFIQSALHKATITLNEKGTEAAAATAISAGTTSVGPETVNMKVNKPFIFAIKDNETGNILFAGRVLNPNQ